MAQTPGFKRAMILLEQERFEEAKNLMVDAS